ncbi:MAG: flagellar basal body P-ring protein FlgI [Gammaproteobacteria bacterium]|nr:flagellar basal body P-ring protein FlgI [Gammaproteobacteria bacterium]
MNKTLQSIAVLLLLTASTAIQAERVKDIASVAGVRSNQLVGYGLVVGLDGTGDQTTQTPFTVQSMKSMLNQFGVTLPAGANLQLKNVAAVMVHAELPAFSKPGQNIDITVSSIGNSKSLRGGTLLMTPLKAVDGNIYAMAQGSLVVGGLGVEGADGSRVTINIPSAGRIPNGAIVERAVPTQFGDATSLIFNLHSPDFTTAHRLTKSINDTMGLGTARAIDAASIQVNAPLNPSQRVTYLSMLENLTLTPDEGPARIIINSRTGTVVIGRNVRVLSAAVSHGSLTVTIKPTTDVNQPDTPLAGGETVATAGTDIIVNKGDSRMFMFEPGVELNEIVRAVNQVGAAPGDLVAILEALKTAGALRAELMVI